MLKSPGFFWTMGKFRWLEALLLAALGVLVRRLLDFSLTYARLRRPGLLGGNELPVPWNPRESVRTVVYLAFTPFLALAVVWALTATDILADDAILLGDIVSHGIILISFLLGLFPDVAYDVLNRVVQGVFGGSGNDERDRRSGGIGGEQLQEPRTAGEPTSARTTERDTGDPPSFETLRIRIHEILTGPLR